jgi:hypothetical protein
MARPAADDPAFRLLLGFLAARQLAPSWVVRADPLADLATECRAIAADTSLSHDLREYLDANPIIENSLTTLLAHLAMAAGVRWHDAAPILHPLARRGWHIGRWLPTFLLVDGPLGR